MTHSGRSRARALALALGLAAGGTAGLAAQEPRVVIYGERGFIGEVVAAAEGEPDARCARFLLVERRAGEEPLPGWAITEFDALRVCVPARTAITVWTADRTTRAGTLEELAPGARVRVSVGQGVFMTEPPTADAFSIDILEYEKTPPA